MSGIDTNPAPDDRFRAINDAISATPPAAAMVPPMQSSSRPIARPFPLHPNFWWAILWCIGVLLFTQVPGGILSVVLVFIAVFLFPQRIRLEDLKDMPSMIANPISLSCFGIGLAFAHGLMIVISLVLLRVVVGRDWPRQVALRRPSWFHVGLVFAIWPAFSFLANAVVYIIQNYLHLDSKLFGSEGMSEALSKAITGWALPPAVFIIAVMPAFSEELWCRAFLGRGLVGKHGVVLGVLGTSILFGVLHLDPVQGLMAMVMGIGLHYIYLMTRSLFMPMLMHFLNNALSVTLASIPYLASLDSDSAGPPLALYTGSMILLIAVCWALYESRARLIDDGTGSVWRPPYPGVACPPPGTGTRIFTPAPSGLALALVAAGLVAFVVGVLMTIHAIDLTV